MDIAPLAASARQGPLLTRNGTALSSDFETFLRMLTAQMQNQDPLNPLESTEFAVQLATFSSVEQQVRSNDLLEGLSSQMALVGLAQMADWVGMEARAVAPTQFSGAPVELFAELPKGADAAELVVTDAEGAEVFRGAITAGILEWDGRTTAGGTAPHGIYEFTLDAFAGDAPLGSVGVPSYAEIDEVRLGPTGPVVVLAGGVNLAAGEVTALRRP